MERSGSQKALLILSIINIILAVIIIFSGIIVNVFGGMFGASPEAAELAGEVAAETGQAVTGGEIGMLAIIGGMGLIISGVIELIMGILGVRAANDNQKIMPVWVISLLSLAFGVASFIMAVIGGSIHGAGDVIQYLTSLVFSALMFWIANNIKKQAGK